MFIDEAHIRIKAGDGGNGCMAFRREKFVPRGGPSGGDGGHGGDILMRSSLSHNTLIHFRFNPEWKSERGGHGLGSNMSGSSGEPTVLNVPVGTLIYDEETGELLHDFTRPNEEIVIARGGRGGRGNQHFATSTHQAPREHELGRPGEARNYRLELRLLADAGLVGYPNVGKSTLISRLSAARPKIANYAFTTLEPNLGVVQVGDPPYEQSFTVADMPGLIEGASQGAGLGTQFLRHIERTSVLVHLVDVSDALDAVEGNARPDPVEDFKVITAELKAFDPAVAAKPTILVATKADVANPDKLKKLKAFASRRKLPFYTISAVTGEGVDKLKYAIAEAVAEHRTHEPAPPPEPAIYKTAQTQARLSPTPTQGIWQQNPLAMPDDLKKKRCGWVSVDNPLMLRYHDREWGVPVHEDRKHFEFLILEGAQAGLSWSIILNKREGYRHAFAEFDPEKVARFTPPRLEKLALDPGIVRNRLKIESSVRNARAFLKVQEEFGSFDAFCWRFVNGKPKLNKLTAMQQIPATSPESDAFSKDLKKRGFNFVGSTVMYAYMQAVGMVNDHLTDCFRYRELR